MKLVYVITGLYILLLVGLVVYIQQAKNVPVNEPEQQVEIIHSYGQYENNSFARSFCRKSDLLVKVYQLREKAFRDQLFENLDLSDMIERFDERIKDLQQRMQKDVDELKRSGLELPSEDDCNYIW